MIESTRILALDYGEKRIGVAISDPMNIIATGIGIIQNDNNLMVKINDLVKRYNPIEIVIGLPTNLKGEHGNKAKEVTDFSEKLKNIVSIPIKFWDERFSSKIAHDAMREVGLKKKKRAQKERVDEIAAIIILRDYMEFKKNRLI
jgi:putative Holliday junction resolvase